MKRPFFDALQRAKANTAQLRSNSASHRPVWVLLAVVGGLVSALSLFALVFSKISQWRRRRDPPENYDDTEPDADEYLPEDDEDEDR